MQPLSHELHASGDLDVLSCSVSFHAGAAACVVPVYIAEVAPYASRGGLAYLFQLAITAGILGALFSILTFL